MAAEPWHGFNGTDHTNFIGPAGSTTISNGIGHTSVEVAAGASLARTATASVYAEVGRLSKAAVGRL
ncbi:MAG: hypothetical protein JWQ73_2617 [Variovorax sp.]|nr:hypothetical protein [Variovorax sp.]